MKLGNVLIIGDSYSTYEGHVPAGYAPYYTGHRGEEPDLFDVKDTWWHRVITATGATLVQNNSWSGSTIGYTGYNNSDNSHSSSFIYRFNKLLSEGFFTSNKIDTILIFGGTNDSWCDAPLGEMKYDGVEEDELYSVLPAICHFAKRLNESLSGVRIIFIGNSRLKPEITGALSNVCERYGFEYIALTDVEKISDHPTALGMKEISEQVLAAI